MIRSMTSPRTRPGTLDVAIAAVAAVVAGAFMTFQVLDDSYAATWPAVPLFMLCVVPLLWRRVAPLGAALAALGITGVHAAVFGDDVIRCGVLIPVALLLAFACGARLDRVRALAGLVAILAFTALVCVTDHPLGADAAAFYTFAGPIVAAVWVVGLLVRARGRMVAELQTRTAELREARDERARLEVAGDRARLSGELDALLTRRLDALAALADEGAGHEDPAAASAALARIEAESRATLDQMRAVVGVLRDDGDEAEWEPQPTLTQLDALLLRAGGPGARLRVEGRPRALPAAVELSAYRVVEHLLEALEDPGEAEVVLRFQDEALGIDVGGRLRRRGGAALERARERARLHGGSVALAPDAATPRAEVLLPMYATV